MHRKGHELGSRRPGWRYPSGQWLAQAERELAFSRRLPALLRGDDQPKDNAERLAFARIASNQRQFAAAARLFAEALESDSKLGDDRRTGYRYEAACAASLAAAGLGKDEPPAGDAAKAKLRRQALDWLKAELAVWTKLLGSGPPEARPFIVQTLNHWRKNPDLAGLRDATALAKLSTDEQKAFTQFWADVAALLQKAETPAARRQVPVRGIGVCLPAGHRASALEWPVGRVGRRGWYDLDDYLRKELESSQAVDIPAEVFQEPGKYRVRARLARRHRALRALERAGHCQRAVTQLVRP